MSFCGKSAIYGHAESADIAADTDKLGGYDASEYLRKDEVKSTVAAYIVSCSKKR